MQLVSTPAARAAQRLQACIHVVELALRELDHIGFNFENGIHRQSALQLPSMDIISHITTWKASTLWRASPVYDPAENPRTSMSLVPSGMDAVTRWGKHARTNSSLPCGW